uniref:Uncharacterized protein n=1 Tax=Oryza glumipatula TaxID=40148 RepID=A0A0D9YG45_9ORYZ
MRQAAPVRMECFIGCFKEWEASPLFSRLIGGEHRKDMHLFLLCTAEVVPYDSSYGQKNLTLALCQALLLLSNLHINIVPSFGDMGALGIDLCRRSRLRWPHGDGLHASGLADGRDVQPLCWPHAVVLLRHRPRERLHHAAVGVAHSPWASSPPAPDLATGGPDLPHTTPAACSRVRRAPLGLLRAPSRRHERLLPPSGRANLCPAVPATVPARSGVRATDPDAPDDVFNLLTVPFSTKQVTK